MIVCLIQVCMHIYRLDAIYYYAVIGLIHIMKGVLVIYILSICNTCYTLFQFDTVSVVSEYRAAHIAEIVLLNFSFCLYQMLPTLYHNKDINVIKLSHNLY